jgi:hypothetical protein
VYKKGRLANKVNPTSINNYIDKMVTTMHPFVNDKLVNSRVMFVNIHELDDVLCDDMKNDDTKIDGRYKWIEIKRNIRLRIISTTLKRDFGYILWSGNSHRVLYNPKTSEPIKSTNGV